MKDFVSSNLISFRNKIGLTQEDLAQRAGVSRQTIIAIEKGNYTPSVLLALKIAGIFKVPVEKIFKIYYEK